MRSRTLQVVILGLLCPAFPAAAEPGTPSKSNASTPVAAAPPSSLVFEVRRQVYSSFPPSQQETTVEVRARPGDGVGRPYEGRCPFKILEIIDKDTVRVEVSNMLVREGEKDRFGGVVVVKSLDKLEAWTLSNDAGESYTLRISLRKTVPAVVADSPVLITAISAHANITNDDSGSVQDVQPLAPPGRVGRFTDNDLADISKLNNLRRLSIGQSVISEAGYARLKTLTRLVDLDLSHSNVTDAALCNLSGLDQLETLSLFRTRISNAGLRYLVDLPGLRELDIGDTKVDDEGVQVLREMQQLRSVALLGSGITRVGFCELERALPEREFRPWRTESMLSGRLVCQGRSFGPGQFAERASEREKALRRILELGCNLRENQQGKVVEAWLCVGQATETFDLLGELNSVETLHLDFDASDSKPIMFAKLATLKELDLSHCGLSEAGWMNVGRLSQLRKLNLANARISEVSLRKLRNSLPNCEIDGQP
jgi:hypothetical protein